jgi:hypothetical protein
VDWVGLLFYDRDEKTELMEVGCFGTVMVSFSCGLGELVVAS